MTWCGFIDLLGTKESANASESKLRLGLSDLHLALKANFDLLGGGKCFAFSDGAFFETQDIKAFVQFYEEVRRQLFANGHFFKCSITQGNLDIDLSLSDKPGEKPLSEMKFASIRFGGGAPRAYIDQDKFKGIGAILSEHGSLTPEEKKCFARSFYFASDNFLSAREYMDVRFSSIETGAADGNVDDWEELSSRDDYVEQNSFLEIYLQEFSKAKARSKRYGRYYVPTLVAMARSLKLNDVEYDGREWHGAPYFFSKVMISRQFENTFSDVNGIHLLYWVLVDEIFSQNKETLSAKSKLELLSILRRRKAAFKEVDSIPDFIAARNVREELLGIKARVDATFEAPPRPPQV